MRKKRIIRNFVIIVTFTLFHIGFLSAAPFDNPIISIINDDIGYRNLDDLAAIKLTGHISYVTMSHSPYAEKISKLITAPGGT